MMRMNCRPPRPMAASRVATHPAAKARIRKSERLNIGSATRRSITAKIASSTTPPASEPTTPGAVQPIVWPPCGWMPYVMPTITAMRPSAKVRFPHQSIREGRVPPPVDSRGAGRAGVDELAVAPDGAEDADRHGHDEDEPPLDRGEDAAEDEADERAGDRGDAVDAEREAALVRREGVGEDRARVREQHCAADALDDAHADHPQRGG